MEDAFYDYPIALDEHSRGDCISLPNGSLRSDRPTAARARGGAHAGPGPAAAEGLQKQTGRLQEARQPRQPDASEKAEAGGNPGIAERQALV